ncbi:DUF4214 domain-containing protein [Pseudomonas monteilii]|uniref:DUF4214 domain-containing protein n=1 Tax=Pseudomonas monteilii TaxID=76759 RepID=A0A7X3F336_9PSED|nr:DUF4214 domain-containing protein [Pseudomonas monteilii]MVF50577.1 DUF4214 domain-containing protein [Pseudomonas monteilii]
MADTDVQGMLVRIEATTAQLRQEMARGETAVAATSKNMDSSLARVDDAFDRAGASARGLQGVISSVVSTFGGFNIAAVGSVAGLVALTQGAISNAREIQNLSSVANASVEEFQRMAYGAKSVGVEQDKLGDILKDVNDRVGEFLQRGGGEMADFFKEIAPLVGVTADQFRNLSGPQALQLYYDSLQKAGLNQQQMTTYMEQMADEATALIPLLRDNGKGFKDAGDQAEKLGLILKQVDTDRLANAEKAVRELEAAFSGISKQIALGLVPGIERVTQSLANLRDSDGTKQVGRAIAFLAENVDVLAAAVGGKLTAAFIKYGLDAVASAGVAGKAIIAETASIKASAIAKAEEAGVTAESTAAKLRDAVASASSAKALSVEAAARVSNLQAVRDSLAYQAALAAGTKEEGRLKASLAAIELELAAARKAATAAATAEAAASNSAAAAMARDTAATQANIAAQAEAASAKGLLARAASGLMGLMGGPTGLIALAIGVGAAYLTLRDNTSTLEKKLGDLADPLDKLIDRFNKLNKATQAVTLRELQASIDEAQRKLNETSGAIADKFENDLRNVGAAGADGLMAGLAPLPEDVQGALNLVRKAAQDTASGLEVDWKAVADEVRKVPGVSEEMAQAIEEGQIRASDLGVSLQKLKGDLQALTAEIKENTVATGENNAVKAGMSATEETYLQALQKRSAALEDGNSETKKATRWLSEQKNVTEEGRKAILDEAAAADRQREAKEAATKAEQASTSAAKESATETKNQAKALTDLQAQTKIAVESAGGLAAAYLAGADKSREFTLQQKVEEALLRSGAGARKEVEAAIRGQADAEDGLAVAKSAFDLAEETELLLAQARATLQGTAALEAYNLQKAMQVALSGKNVAAGSKEYKQLLEATKAQQNAVKVAKQAADAGSIMDRLYPEKKLLREYTEGQEALNKAMELAPDKAAEYQEALRLLGLEYEQNRNAATAWGKFTEGALDRVDGAFADAWKSIGDGFDGFATSLKEGFKQLLAELAHMAITRPIVMQIGAALGVGGLSAQASGLFGGSASGGGLSLSSLWNAGSGAYSAATSGFGSAVTAGWNAGQGFLGGMQGAISGGYNYISNGLSGLFSSGAAAGSGSTIAGYTSPAFQNWVGAQQAAAYQVSGLTQAMAGVGGAIYGYGQSGLKGAVTGGLGGWGGSLAGAAAGTAAGTYIGGTLGSVLPGIGTAIGAALGSYLGGSLFGGSWQTKDVGLSLGVTDGEFIGQQFEYQKKKGGLFGKNKKRTRYSALDPETQEVLDNTYDATIGGVESLFEQLNVSLNDGVLDGLDISAVKISTKDKTAEEIQKELDAFFGDVAQRALNAISDATGSGISGVTVEQLTAFVNTLYAVNGAIKHLNIGLYDTSIAGGKLAEQLAAAAGGLDVLTASAATYYDAFYTDAEKAGNTLSDVREQFTRLNLALPETREGYRGLIESLDKATESGRNAIAAYLNLSGAADQMYDILEAKALQSATDLAASLQASVNGALGAMQRAVNAQKSVLTDAYNAQVASLNDMSQTAQKSVSDLAAVGGSLSRALKALRGDSDDAVKVLRAQALATLNSALATVKAGKSLAGIVGLDDALDAVSQNSTDAYASLEAYNRDQGRTANIVSALEAANGKQLSAAEKTVNSLQTRVEQAKKAYDLQIAQYDSQLSLAQAQIDALNGVDNSVISVAAAVNGLSQAVTAALAIADDNFAKQNTYDNNAAIVRAVYRTVLGREAESKGLADWAGALTGGLVTYDELMASIARQGRANGETIQIPGFASGGLFSGGARVVGERGPELEVTGPSRIYSASQTAAMLGGGNGDVTAAEVRELRGELKSALFAIAKYAQKAAKNTDLLPLKLEQELFS